MTTEKDESPERAPMTESPPAAEREKPRRDPGREEPRLKKSPLVILFRHWRLLGVLALVLAVAGTYLWKNVAVSRAKEQLSRQAGQVLAEQHKSFLRLAAVPLVWTIRSEMMRGNYDQINQYLAQFVREPNMKEVLVARADGRIVAASNKKRDGTMVTDLFPPETPKVDTVTVTTRQDGMFVVAAPIMGLNDKLGVLILVAAPPDYTLGAPSR